MEINLNIPTGKSGDWEIDTFNISEEEAKKFNLHCLINCNRRFIYKGTYYRLSHKGNVIMSNTQAEILDHAEFIKKAKGVVLVAGLGLGMVIQGLLDRGNCSKIVVVEKSKDVINLVGEHYRQKGIEIVHDDIFKYKPEEHFDYAWFDIWGDICGDNYTQMVKLHRHFRGKITNMMDWCNYECKKLNNE
ncbi:MAG: hypothetical protein WAR39_01655 [Prevotella sp.]